MFFNIFLSCNINIPSFIRNLWWVLLLGNHLFVYVFTESHKFFSNISSFSFPQDSTRGCRAKVWYRTTNTPARLGFAPEDSQPCEPWCRCSCLFPPGWCYIFFLLNRAAGGWAVSCSAFGFFFKPRSRRLGGFLLCLRFIIIFLVLSVTISKLPLGWCHHQPITGHFSALFVISPLRRVLLS